MTHPYIEELVSSSIDLVEARERFAELYQQSDDQAVLEAAWDVERWLDEVTDRPPCPLPLEVRKRMVEAMVVIHQLSKRHRANLEWLEHTRR